MAFIPRTYERHSFSVAFAVEHGVNAAILMECLLFWVRKNEANGRHYHDGRYWTYNSIAAFEAMYPYMSKSTIHRTLQKLEADGYILTGDYSEEEFGNKLIRTKWYAVTEKMGRFIAEEQSAPSATPGQDGKTISRNGKRTSHDETSISRWGMQPNKLDTVVLTDSDTLDSPLSPAPGGDDAQAARGTGHMSEVAATSAASPAEGSTPGFDELAQTAPNKNRLRAARVAYMDAIARGATPDEVAEAWERYMRDYRNRNGQNDRYVMNLESFLIKETGFEAYRPNRAPQEDSDPISCPECGETMQYLGATYWRCNGCNAPVGATYNIASAKEVV